MLDFLLINYSAACKIISFKWRDTEKKCCDLPAKSSVHFHATCGLFCLVRAWNFRTSICDGIRDCANGEDEEECLRLLADSESMPDGVDYIGISRPSGILLVRRWGSEFSPVCLGAEFDLQTESQVGSLFCNHFGYARLLYAEPLLLPKSAPSSSTKFYSYSAQPTIGDPSRHFVPSKLDKIFLLSYYLL